MSSHPQAPAPSWSRQEFAGLDLGDTRLNNRLVDIADALAAQPMSPIRTEPVGDWSSVKQRIVSLTMTRFRRPKKFSIHTFNRRLNACGVMSVSLRSKIQPIWIIPIIPQRRD